MFSTILSRLHRSFWKKIMQKECFNFPWAEIFNRNSYDNPEPKHLFVEKQIESKKSFSHFSIWDTYSKTFEARFLVIPNCKLEVLRPHITLKFSKFSSWVSLSRYRYNCMQYMQLREYMHHLRTQRRFKLCMHFADSVQYVIDDIVRENVPAYLCLWPSYVNFYREEKKRILRLPNQTNGALRHDESCCFLKISELTAFLVRIFVEHVCCMFDKAFILPFDRV